MPAPRPTASEPAEGQAEFLSRIRAQGKTVRRIVKILPAHETGDPVEVLYLDYTDQPMTAAMPLSGAAKIRPGWE